MTAAESIARLQIDEQERGELKRDYAWAIIDAPAVAGRLPISDHPPLARRDPPLGRRGEVQYREWLEHPDHDDYLSAVDALANVERIAAPMRSIAGAHATTS